MKTITVLLLLLLACASCNLAQTPAAPPTVTLPPAPTSPPLDTYTNNAFSYTLQYPTGLSLEANDDESFVWLDRQIYISVSPINPEEMQGDGPVIESAEDTSIGEYSGRHLTGFIGSIGGNTPQSYESVAIPHNGLYYLITVYELKNDAPLDDTHQPGDIPTQAQMLFEQVLGSLRFTG